MRTTRLLPLATILLLAMPAAAFEVADISMKELDDLSIIEFESSFCGVMIGDTVTVMLTGDEGDAASATIVAASLKIRNSVTPNRGRKRGGSRSGEITPVIGSDGRTIDVTLEDADEGWRTAHVRVELDTGDKLGVNLHSMPCEGEDDTGNGDDGPVLN